MCRGKMNSVVTQVNDPKLSPTIKCFFVLLSRHRFDPHHHPATHRQIVLSQISRQGIELDIWCMKLWMIFKFQSSSVLASAVPLQPPRQSTPFSPCTTHLRTAFNLRKFSCITSLPPLAVCSCLYHIQSPVLAYQPLKGSAPLYFQACVSSPTHHTNTPSRCALRYKKLAPCYKKPSHHLFTLVPSFQLPNGYSAPV